MNGCLAAQDGGQAAVPIPVNAECNNYRYGRCLCLRPRLACPSEAVTAQCGRRAIGGAGGESVILRWNGAAWKCQTLMLGRAAAGSPTLSGGLVRTAWLATRSVVIGTVLLLAWAAAGIASVSPAAARAESAAVTASYSVSGTLYAVAARSASSAWAVGGINTAPAPDL